LLLHDLSQIKGSRTSLRAGTIRYASDPLDGVEAVDRSTHAIDATASVRRRGGPRWLVSGEEGEGRLPSAPRAAPVNLFSRFQVDSPWRIMTTVDFRRAPERRARWVARSNMMELR